MDERLKRLEDRVDALDEQVAYLEESIILLADAPKAKPPKEEPQPRPEPHVARVLISAPRKNYSGVTVLDVERGLRDRMRHYTGDDGVFRSVEFFNKVGKPPGPGRYLITIPVFWRKPTWAIRPDGATIEGVGDDVFSLESVGEGPAQEEAVDA